VTNRTRTWHPRGPSADAQIRALLDGTKTQLRLPIKLVQFKPSDTPGYDWCFRGTATGRPTTGTWQDFRNGELVKLSPFGAPGDLLSVREAFRIKSFGAGVAQIRYCADNERGDNRGISDRGMPSMCGVVPAVRCPKHASRLTLLVLDVRVERLQDISEADAESEGCEWELYAHGPGVSSVGTPRYEFRERWDATWIKAGFGWDSNPWVWVANVQRVAK
jgi:hypothetical protein